MFAPHHDGASPFHHVLIPGGAGIAGDGVSGGGPWAGLGGEPAATVPYPSIGTHPGSAGGAGGFLSRMGTLPATPEGEEEATGMAAHEAEDAWQQQQLQRTAGGITSPWLTEAAAYRQAASTQEQSQAAKQAAGMMGGHKMAAMLNMALSANRAKHGAASAVLDAGTACEQDDSKAPGDTVKRRTWQLPDSASPPVSLRPSSPAAAQQSGTATATNSWMTAHDTAPCLSHNTPSPGQAPHTAATLPSEPSPQVSHAASTCGPHPASLAIYAQQPIASPRQPPLASHHSSKATCSFPSGLQPELSQVPSGPWSGFGQINSNAAQASPQARATGSGMVRMPRSEAWAKFLAYEGCIQVCAGTLLTLLG